MPRASGSTPRRWRTAVGSFATSMPSTSIRPWSGFISVYSMRRVVVLPAPLGPSSPVISPSRASKPTPFTACTVPALVLNDLCRFSSRIMSRLPTVVAGERRLCGQAVEAGGVQRLRVRGLDELREQLGHAADADHVVALPGQHDVARVGQRGDH